MIMAVPIMSEREVLTWSGFGSGVRELAAMVVDSGFEPDIVLGIARGGQIPTGSSLCHQLQEPVHDQRGVLYRGQRTAGAADA